MKPISQKKKNKTKWLTFLAQYVKSQLELIMKQFAVTNIINGSIQDAIISVKKLTNVSRKTQHHGTVSFVSVPNFHFLN